MALASVLVAAGVVDSGAAEWLRNGHAVRAAAIDPLNGRIAIEAALERVKSGSSPSDPQVQALVHRALSRDLTMPAALEFLAVRRQLAGDPDSAAALYRLSDRVSRRSLPTRLWLAQDAVERGDAAVALAQMDLALRTSSTAPDVVFPALARALEDPALVPQIAALADRPSGWRESFLHYVATDASPVAAGQLFLAIKDRRGVGSDQLDRTVIARLADDGKFRLARQVDLRFGGRRANGVIPLNGGFADETRYPFGWAFVDRSAVGASAATEGQAVLAYHASSAEGGQVAARLLDLGPGEYLLQSRTGSSSGSEARPQWVLSCASAKRVLATLQIAAGGGDVAAAPFSVPAACEAQWLVLMVQPSIGAQLGEIENVSIRKR